MIDYKKKIAEIIAEDEALNMTPEEILEWIEIPGDTKMGDYAFPCFRLAKTLRKAPPLIAQDVAARIEGAGIFEKVQPVNAYVNMFLDKKEYAQTLTEDVLTQGKDYGRSEVGQHRPVIVEYSSPNIAKPFHIGHIRSTVIGNAIYKLYDEIGYDVIRINHLGDYGTQFGKMIVAYRKWGSEEELEKDPIKALLGYYTRFHREAENDPSLDDEAREAFVKLENGEEEEVRLWKRFRELSLQEFNRVYDMLGITFDSYAGESFYSDKMPAVIEELKEKIKDLKVIAIEPDSSAVLSGEKAGAHKIQGIGAGFVPKVLDTDIYDAIVRVKNEDAFTTGRLVGHKEGVLVGISSGAAVYAAIELAKKEENKGKTIVVLLPDSGDRYLSTDLFGE